MGKAAELQREAGDYSIANPVAAEHVWNQLATNYPASAIKFVRHASWTGPVNVDHHDIDYDDEDKWAASHQPSAIASFTRDIKADRQHLHPVVMYKMPGKKTLIVGDGHHRTLAYRKLHRPVKAYVGKIKPADMKAAIEMHVHQVHQGAHPMNKAASSDPVAGMWEAPGGHINPGETAIQAAAREWAEETGLTVPRGELTGNWRSSGGTYEGFVLTIPHEKDLSILGRRNEAFNPDDPDGDMTEAVAWWEPSHLKDNPVIRPELMADIRAVLDALGLPDEPGH